MLSIIYSNNFEFKIIHNFKPKDFNPKPNVGIVLLYVKKVNKQIKNSVEFYDFVSFIFKQTNKNLIKTLGKILSSKQISTLKKHNFFNDFQIPSMLDFENFKKLYDLFESRSDTNKSIIRGSYFELLQLESKIKKDNRTRVKQKNFKY